MTSAAFIRAGFADLAFDGGSFDAITCFYALIHIPLRSNECCSTAWHGGPGPSTPSTPSG